MNASGPGAAKGRSRAALPSIRRRLLGVLVLVGLAWNIATTVALGLVVRHEVDEVLDHSLQEAAEVILGVLRMEFPGRSAEVPASPGPATTNEEELVWQIVSKDGRVDQRSHQAPVEALTTQKAKGFSTQGSFRVFAVPFDDQGRMLLVAQTGEERDEARVDPVLWAIATSLAIGTIAVAWLHARTRAELQPIDEMAAAVRRHDPVAPASALPVATRAELLPMHDAIDDLGTRLVRRIANERQFTAHAAHAIRTPLASLIANLSVAHRRTVNDDDRAFIQSSLEAAQRLRRVVSALLTMFKSGGDTQLRTFDLRALVRELSFEWLDVRCDAPDPIRGDPDLIAATLMNLLDNAQRHGAGSAHIRAAVQADGTTRIEVRDDGPGIPADELDRLQAAMDEEDYVDNTGLGLMLADLVARAHAGRCTLVRVETGCMVVLTLAA